MKKHWRKILSIIILAVVLLAFGCHFLLQTSLVTRLLLNQANQYLRHNANVELGASRLKLNLFKQSITLENATIRATSAPDLPPLFRASRIYARLGVLSTIRGLLTIEDLQITAPKVHCYVGQDDRTNLPTSVKKAESTARYLIVRASADNGSIRYENRRQQTDLNLPVWHLGISGNPATLDHQLDYSTQRGGFIQTRDQTIPMDSIQVQGSLKRDALEIGLARLSSQHSILSAKGTIRGFSNPQIDLHLIPDLDLQDLAATAAIGRRWQGKLTGSVHATGPIPGLEIQASIRGINVTAESYKGIGLDSSIRATLNDGSILLRDFQLRFPQGSLQGAGTLITGSNHGVNHLDVALKDFDFYPAWRLIHPSFDLASRGTGKISMNWDGPLGVSNLNGRANLDLRPTRRNPGRYILPVSGNVVAEMRAGRMTGALQAATIVGTRLRGSFSMVSFKTIDAAVHGDSANIESSLSSVSEFIGNPDPTLVGMKLVGPVQFVASISGPLANPLISATVHSPSLQAGNLKGLGVDADTAIKDSQVEFRGSVALSDASVIEARGTVAFSRNRARLQLDASTSRVPAGTILPILGSSIPAKGELNGTLHLDGPVDNLTGYARIAGTGLSIYQEPLGQFETNLQVSGNEIRSNPFRFIRDAQHPDTNYIDAAFSYGLNSGQFAIRANGKDLIWEQHQFHGTEILNGKINLSLSGQGTFEKPVIDLKLESGNIQVRERRIGPITVLATMRDNHATINATAPQINISSSAHIGTLSPYPFDAEMHIQNTDVSLLGLTAANKQPVTGTIAATLNSDGNLDAIKDSHFAARIQKLDLRSGNLEMHTDGILEAEYRNQSIAILKPATIVSGNSSLLVSGSVPMEQTGAPGTVMLKGQVDLAQAAAFLPRQEGLAVAGTVNLNLSVSGNAKQINASGLITMDDGYIRVPHVAMPISNILLRASLANGSLVLDRLEARLGLGSLALKGELPLGLLPNRIPIGFPQKKGPAKLEADIVNFQPEAAGLLPQGVEGFISLHASGQAAGMNLDSVNADIVFRQLGFKVNEMTLGQKDASTIVVRNGVATISKLALTGTETSIQATGSASLLPEGPLNLRLLGSFDAALLTFMEKDLKTAGKMLVRIAVGGNRRSPSLSGVAEMTGGRLTMREPRVVADSLRMGLDLAPNRITLREFKSTLNGGTLTASGTIGYDNRELNNFNLKAAVQDAFLEFPDGLRSAANADLTITSSDENILVGGTVRILESSYREPFAVTGSLLSFLRSQRVMIGSTAPNPLLQRVRFNVAMRTSAPLLVQNNIAKAEASANIRLVGSFYQPSFVGRVTLDQGGEIVMNQRTYYIERGTVTLTDQSEIRPELDIEAQTKVDPYTVTLRLTGPPERLSTILSSEPSLPEPDILSLLLTGKVSSESTQQVARSQALALVAGQAGEEITREARQALHLSTFRLDPGGLIASESDLGARLTIGEDITRKLSLAYSMDLVNSGKQIWAAQYKITRTLTTQATKQEDNSYRAEFRHDLRFGGAPATRASRTAQTKFTIGSIQFRGQDPEFESKLRERFKVKPGDRYDFPKVQKGLDRLHAFYSDQKRLEANIRLQRETQDKNVSLDISIEPGPILEFSYQGFALSQKIREQVEADWKNGVFDIERLEDAVNTLRRQLLLEGYLQAKITHAVETQADRKIVHFVVEPGTKFSKIPVLFPDASGISATELINALDKSNLELDIYADPQKVADYIKQYYRERGFLQANIALPKPKLDPKAGTGEVAIPVQEGPLFKVGDLEFESYKAFDYDQLWSVIPTSTGSIYNPKSMQDAMRALETLYHGKGYNDVSVTYRVLQEPKAARADVAFQITERRQSIIREIEIEGNRDTSRGFIQRQLDFEIGDVLDLNRIDTTRKRLYTTGVYTSVDFQNEELPGSTLNSAVKNMRVRIRVREARPYRLQYGVLYDTDRGPGGLLEAQNLNVFGRASSLGMKLRYDSNLKEARISYNQPFVTNNFLKLDATAFVQKETRVAFDAKRVGFALFREKALARKYVFDYGYRYDYVRWDGLPPDPTLYQSSAPVSRLVATVTRDTRDSILDATRGEFTSHSFEFGPSWLGSETGFARYSGQYFRYVPLDKYLGKPVKDKEGNRLPASLVYAGALRLGLTTAFSHNQEVISPERFFAGGGTTMRGFKQDMLGPTKFETDRETGELVERPVGGEAQFLFNNEIRFPIVSIFQGVGFVDIGNIYPRISDFNFSLRKTAGIGLRLKIKFVPIRFDYGFKLDRRTGESRGAFFFSIGQAF